MSNLPLQNQSTTANLTLPQALEWLRLGWEDVRHGLGYRDAYERATQAEQADYEIGRMEAMNVVTAELPVPPWPDSRILPVGISASCRAAIERIGQARCDWEIVIYI